MPENPDYLSTWRSPSLPERDVPRFTGLRSDCDHPELGILGAIATMIANQERIIANQEMIIASQEELIAK